MRHQIKKKQKKMKQLKIRIYCPIFLDFNNFAAAFNSYFYWIFYINLYLLPITLLKKHGSEYAYHLAFSIVSKPPSYWNSQNSSLVRKICLNAPLLGSSHWNLFLLLEHPSMTTCPQKLQPAPSHSWGEKRCHSTMADCNQQLHIHKWVWGLVP